MKPMSPKNELYIIKEGPISDGNNLNHLILFKVAVFNFKFQVMANTLWHPLMKYKTYS